MEKRYAEDRRLLVFLSHTKDDRAWADCFRHWLLEALSHGIRVFQSTDPLAMHGGPWHAQVRARFRESSIFVLLISPESSKSLWVNFEAGAGLGRDAEVLALCIDGQSVDALKSPLKDLQARCFPSEDGQTWVLGRICEHLQRDPPLEGQYLPFGAPGSAAAEDLLRRARARYGDLSMPAAPAPPERLTPAESRRLRESQPAELIQACTRLIDEALFVQRARGLTDRTIRLDAFVHDARKHADAALLGGRRDVHEAALAALLEASDTRGLRPREVVAAWLNRMPGLDTYLDDIGKYPWQCSVPLLWERRIGTDGRTDWDALTLLARGASGSRCALGTLAEELMARQPGEPLFVRAKQLAVAAFDGDPAAFDAWYRQLPLAPAGEAGGAVRAGRAVAVPGTRSGRRRAPEAGLAMSRGA